MLVASAGCSTPLRDADYYLERFEKGLSSGGVRFVSVCRADDDDDRGFVQLGSKLNVTYDDGGGHQGGLCVVS